MSSRRRRPHLQLEMAHLGRVDPFQLAIREYPPGSGEFRVEAPRKGQEPLALERAGLCLVGASQALMDLSLRWLAESGRAAGQDAAGPGGGGGPVAAGLDETPPMAEMRMCLRRREARLLASLLRRHLGRLPQPPDWMRSLLNALDEMDEYLRWQET